MKIILKDFMVAVVLCLFCIVPEVNATTIYVDENSSNDQIFGWMGNEIYDKIILNSNVDVDCFNDEFSINSITNSEKTIDLNGYTLNLGDNCPILINSINSENATINIVDSSLNKSGVLINPIKIRNCIGEVCKKITVNISGGTYNADTFITFVKNETNINGESIFAKNLTLNINNIKFNGNLLFQNYSEKIYLKNTFFYPNMKFLNHDSSIKLKDVVANGYKLVGNNGDISLETDINDLELSNSNHYIAKDIDLFEIEEYNVKNINYDSVENLTLILNNLTEETLNIEKIIIDNTEEFNLTGNESLVIQSGETITSNYILAPKLGLSVGTYYTNIIATDTNGNIYVKNVKFKVENKKIKEPEVSSALTFDYNNEEHEVILSNFDDETMEVVGTYKATESGSYTFSIKPKTGYCWSDGSTDEIKYEWEIILVNEITDLKISGNNNVLINNEYQYNVKITPEDATYKEVIWSVINNTGEATIDENGVLNPVKTGIVKIIATSKRNSSIFAEKEIKIIDENTPLIMVTAPNYYLQSDTNHQFSAILSDNSLNTEIIWTSLNETVATINQNGLLAPKKEGKVVIRVADKNNANFYEDIEVFIYNKDNAIKANVGMIINFTITSTKKCTYSNWEYSNRAMFDSTVGEGRDFSKTPYLYKLFSLKIIKEGYSNINLLCSDSILGSKQVYGYNAINELTSSYDEIILEKNDTFKLDIPSWIQGISDEFNGIYYKIEDDSIAKVNSNGEIKALENGNTNVIIFSKYNNKKLVIPLSVVDDKNNYTILSESISITGETKDLRVGKTFQYEATVKPLNATNKEIKWSVENVTGSATIDENGLLTANKEGIVIVKAISKDGSDVIGTLNVTLKEYIDVENIFIKTKDLYVDTGTSFYMQALVFPKNSTNKKVKWSSSDTSIATIDPDTGGLATSNKKGIVTIKATATDGSGVIGTAVLHVGYTNIKVGEKVSLSSTSYVTYNEVKWNIEDKTIIEPTGKTGYSGINQYYRHYIEVNGLKNGSTTVEMKTISGVSLATTTVYVYTPISSLTNDLEKIKLQKGETKKLNITIKPDDISSELDTLFYTSSNESIAKIDQNGNITALKNGSTDIIVYSQYNNVSVTIPITVVTYTNKLTLDTEKLNLNEEYNNHQIIYEVLPNDASNTNVIFESENPFIAAVSNTGLITAKHNGVTTITVKTEDGKQTKNINVTVTGITKDINELSYQKINDIVYTGLAQTPEISIYEDDYLLIKDIDYTLKYDKNISAGTANIEIEGIGNFRGNKIINFEIKKANIEYKVTEITKTYDGNKHKSHIEVFTPNVTIKYADNEGNYTLDSMPEYINAGIYSIKYQLSADGNYNIVQDEIKLIIKKIDISNKDINLSYNSCIWNGYAKKPIVAIEGLEEGTDFEVAYTNNLNVGTAKVNVIGIGNYEGEITKTFIIKAPVLSAPSSVKIKLYGHDDLKATWSKVNGASGYFVYIKKSTSSSWTYWGRTTGLSMKFANRTDGAKYYVRVIPYKKIGEVRYKGNGKTSGYIYTLKKLNTPKVTKYSKNYVKIKWNNISGESGYQIARKKYGTSTYYIVKNVSYKYSSTILKTTRNKTYYYKVRAYKIVDGKKIYGPWSYVKSYKLKQL